MKADTSPRNGWPSSTTRRQSAATSQRPNTITLIPTQPGTHPHTYTNAEGEELNVMAEECEDAFAFYASLDQAQLTLMCQSG